VSIVEVGDLIAAAGPLTTEHIAGGLNVAVAQASSCVRLMVKRGWLRQDEFGRYRLCV
jgi:DNA-binding IclR family transcriptional regulator